MNKKPIVLGVFLILLMTIISPTTAISKKTSNTNNLNDNGWEYDEETGNWSIEFPAEPLNESFTTKLYMEFVGKVAVIFSHEYYFPQYSDGDKSYVSRGYVEISRDSGETWEIYDVYEDMSSGSVRDLYIIVGQFFRVRFTVEGIGDSFLSESGGFWCIWDIDLIGDTKGIPPESKIRYSGIPWPDSNWWTTFLRVVITAEDITGVKEIHYILNRQETVVAGDVTKFTISTNGINYLSYWTIDNLGNEEIPHIFRPIHIDCGNAPKVKIKFPEPGLYIFGKKMPLSLNKTVIIGGFTIKATAYDDVSGVYKVSFYLNYERIADITEEPYTVYCGFKHSGITTLKVVAEDYAGNMGMASLDISYYKLL